MSWETLSDSCTVMAELLKPKKIKYGNPFKEKRKIMILSPHPDDETIGCGGLIASLVQKKEYQIDVVLFTLSNRKRFAEVKKAKEILGYSYLHILQIPDGKISENLILAINKMEKLLKYIRPDIVLTPYIFDFVPDHFYTNICLKTVLEKNVQYSMKIYMYEIWNMIINPDIYFNTADCHWVKEKALLCYGTQEKKYSLIRKSKIKYEYRYEFNFRKKYEFTECYLEIDKHKYTNILNLLMR